MSVHRYGTSAVEASLPVTFGPGDVGGYMGDFLHLRGDLVKKYDYAEDGSTVVFRSPQAARRTLREVLSVLDSDIFRRDEESRALAKRQIARIAGALRGGA